MLRRRFLIPLILVGAGALFLHFDVYYHVKGWLRGDAYYKGMPTCYWVESLERDQQTPDWISKIYSFLGIPNPQSLSYTEFFTDDPELPDVLMQIAGDKSFGEKLRGCAVTNLARRHGSRRSSQLAELFSRIFADDRESECVQSETQDAWGHLVITAKEAAIDARSLLGSGSPSVRLLAISVLLAQGESLEELGPPLVDLMEKESKGGREGRLLMCAVSIFGTPPRTASVPFLLKMTLNREKWIRWPAVYAIHGWIDAESENGNPFRLDQEPLKSVAQRLQELLSDPEEHIRERARTALACIKRD